MSDERDLVFLDREPEERSFRFDAEVARVFGDMVSRSIPGYHTLLSLIGLEAKARLSAGDLVYDLGASLGAATFAMAERAPQAEYVCVDNSPAMLERLVETARGSFANTKVTPLLIDLTELQFLPCKLVVLNFTLQFLPPESRDKLIAKISANLKPGGALIVSEKLRAADEEAEKHLTLLHDSFRVENGYSTLEIARKRLALERVLIPDTEADHSARFARHGLEVLPWFRALHFVSWLAVPCQRNQAGFASLKA